MGGDKVDSLTILLQNLKPHFLAYMFHTDKCTYMYACRYTIGAKPYPISEVPDCSISTQEVQQNTENVFEGQPDHIPKLAKTSCVGPHSHKCSQKTKKISL